MKGKIVCLKTCFLVAALAQAFHQRTNVTFGLYFSLFEWFHPLYVKDKQNQYRTQSYVDVSEILLVVKDLLMRTYVYRTIVGGL